MGQAARATAGVVTAQGSLQRGLLAEWFPTGEEITRSTAVAKMKPLTRVVGASSPVRKAYQTGLGYSVTDGLANSGGYTHATSGLVPKTYLRHITIEAWAIPNSLAYATMLVGAQQSGAYPGFWFRGANTYGKVSWFAGGVLRDNLGVAAPNDGRMHQFGIRILPHDGSNTRFEAFLDGNAHFVPGNFASNASVLPNGNSDYPLYLGGSPAAGGGTGVAGMSCCRIWDRPLSVHEIRALYTIGPRSISQPRIVMGAPAPITRSYYYRNFVASRSRA